MPLVNQNLWVFATPSQELVTTLRVTISALVDSAVPDNNWEELLPSAFSSKGGDLLEVFAPMMCSAQAQLSPPLLGHLPQSQCLLDGDSHESLPAELGNILLLHPGEGRTCAHLSDTAGPL